MGMFVSVPARARSACFFGGGETPILSQHVDVTTAFFTEPPCQPKRVHTQAVPAEYAKCLPAHWPFGIKADSDSSSDSDDDGRASSRSERQEQRGEEQEQEQEEEADTDSGGEGALPASAITARQDDMAQQAVDALNEAQGLVGPWQQPLQQQQQRSEAAVHAADSRTAQPGRPGGGATGSTPGGAGGGGDGGDGGGGGSSNRFARGMRRVLRLGRGTRGANRGDGTVLEMEEGSEPAAA